MTIYEKIERVKRIGEEVYTIKMTLEAIKIMAATVNAETAALWHDAS